MLNQALLPSKRGSKMSCELLTTTSERRFRPISSCHHPSKEPELSGWKNRSRGQAHRNSLLRRITTRVKPEVDSLFSVTFASCEHICSGFNWRFRWKIMVGNYGFVLYFSECDQTF
ncbi:uncharacterized protein [Phaseolus vulgaris]|uniref:uncharacterized protein isoform X2 n=1 Tax=Phaseolus vulgaris TaxID=3885 RepID=UPI0035CBA958